MSQEPAGKISPAIWGAWVSLISNLGLTIMKLGVGVLFGSQVLVADGVHNAGDVIASGAALSSMRISNRPADEDHPYGHGKAEVLGAAFVAIILAIASLFMAYQSVETLFREPAAPHLLPLIAAAVSLIWKLLLYVYTIRIGRESGSQGLIATANDHLADVYASGAAVLGIMLSLIGAQIHSPYFAYGDPIAGIIVSLLVMRMAYSMGRESFDVLMEHSVDTNILKDYAALIRTVPEVKRIDRLRGRNHGHYIIVDIRVSIPGSLTIQEGHDIGRKIKKVITGAHPDVGEVLVHLNPWYDSEPVKL